MLALQCKAIFTHYQLKQELGLHISFYLLKTKELDCILNFAFSFTGYYFFLILNILCNSEILESYLIMSYIIF